MVHETGTAGMRPFQRGDDHERLPRFPRRHQHVGVRVGNDVRHGAVPGGLRGVIFKVRRHFIQHHQQGASRPAEQIFPGAGVRSFQRRKSIRKAQLPRDFSPEKARRPVSPVERRHPGGAKVIDMRHARHHLPPQLRIRRQKSRAFHQMRLAAPQRLLQNYPGAGGLARQTGNRLTYQLFQPARHVRSGKKSSPVRPAYVFFQILNLFPYSDLQSAIPQFTQLLDALHRLKLADSLSVNRATFQIIIDVHESEILTSSVSTTYFISDFYAQNRQEAFIKCPERRLLSLTRSGTTNSSKHKTFIINIIIRQHFRIDDG